MCFVRLIIAGALLCTLASCEGAVSMEGHVYDKVDHHAIDRAQVILVLKKTDTIWKCKPPTRGDDLMRDNNKLAFTDINGHFSISSGLIRRGAGEFNAKIIFLKNGYAPVVLKVGHDAFDSVLMQHYQDQYSQSAQ
ncbi:MAG: hypothetical protein K0Q79_3150 [Flavipsychrobacter sp.]|jgi:hypothetical protein|nr:hypothetical protein [Flavipsychrobacter sp.]